MINRSLTTSIRQSPHKNILNSKYFISILSIISTLILTKFIIPSISSHSTLILHKDLSLAIADSKGKIDLHQKLLILTPLKDAERWLQDYFINLDKLNYPKNDITLAFLVSDTTDQTINILKSKAKSLANRSPINRYHQILIYEKDFHFNLASQVRHGFEGQPVRRAFIARARNFLLTAALRHDHAWVLWLDVDVVRYDADIVTDLMSVDKDVVVPNTLWYQQDTWDFWVSSTLLLCHLYLHSID
jgi:hypothetical protein